MEQTDYRLAAIMYTDIAGFSRMMERDEAGTLQLLKYHNDLIGGIVEAHHGTIIKTIGDALLVDFKNTVEALQSALEIQDKLYVHNKDHSELPLLVRIGVHLGDIYFFENDALGEGINIAARLQSLARPGCICFSQDVYNLVLNKIEFRAEKLGKVSLKNITKEIHAYEITSPNVEFDPNRDKPRPGYTPGTYLGDEGAEENSEANSTVVHYVGASVAAPQGRPMAVPAAIHEAPAPDEAKSEPRPEPAPTFKAPEEPERDYSAEGSKGVLAEIRKAILEDTKAMGRRLSVDEALSRYGNYGVEAQEVIAAMADQGLIIKSERGGDADRFGSDRKDRTDSPSFDGEAFGRNIEAAVHGIVGEIERNVQRGMSEGQYGSDRHAYKYEWKRERHERKRERHEDRHEYRYEGEDWHLHGVDRAATFEDYRDALADRARHQRGGLIGHFTSYLAVNAGLWYIYITMAPYAHWAAIVSAAWGIGLVSSIVASFRGDAKVREAKAVPELEGEAFSAYKKLNRTKDSIAMHAASTITVPILLGIINFCYPGGATFLWFLIPTVAMVASFLSHLGVYVSKRRNLEKRILSSLGIEGGWRNIFKAGKGKKSTISALGAYADQYYEAERAKADILSEMKGDEGATMKPALDAYVGQVRLLASSANEIDRIVEAIPMDALAADKEGLLAKNQAATSPSLKEEYGRSIAEIEKQEQSYAELKNQSEVIRLRLGSSVNQLKQMRIDAARVRAAGEEGTGGMDELKARTEELSRYLEDLRKGYDESGADVEAEDPFAALEKAEEERKLIEGKKKATE